ncbi:hypothetical protein FKM82_021826 [Ascaphus truei]
MCKFSHWLYGSIWHHFPLCVRSAHEQPTLLPLGALGHAQRHPFILQYSPNTHTCNSMPETKPSNRKPPKKGLSCLSCLSVVKTPGKE